MKVDISKCIGCGICVPFCPAKAISVVDRKSYINQDKCLECGKCIRKRTVKCPKDAIYEPEETRQYPRNYRRFFSDPSVKTPSGLPGRGTEEVKTNDVTGRVCRGELGIAIEMGRPVLGTSLKDVEIVSKKLASLNVHFEEDNPLYSMLKNPETGEIKDELLDQKIVSVIIKQRFLSQERVKFLMGLKKFHMI